MNLEVCRDRSLEISATYTFPFFHSLSSHSAYEIKGEGGATVIDIIKSGKIDEGFNVIPLDPWSKIYKSAMNKSATVYLYGFQICCHSTYPIKETWISVRTLHNKSLISVNKVDPLKKAAHKSNWTMGPSTLWLEGCCGNTHLPGLHTKEIQAFPFILCTCGWNEDVWKESNLKQVLVPLLVGFA